MRHVTGSAGSRTLSMVVLLVAGSMCAPGQEVSPPPAPPVQNSIAPLAVPETSAQPAETPGEIYKAAMHPLDVVRSSLDNWSDAELGALSVGIEKAHDACEARKPGDFAGDDLYDLARLCALGQDWDHANAAAQAYITSKLDPHLESQTAHAKTSMKAVCCRLQLASRDLGETLAHRVQHHGKPRQRGPDGNCAHARDHLQHS